MQLLSTYSLCLYFWQKEIGKKAANKMLVKLTPVVNVTIIFKKLLRILEALFGTQFSTQMRKSYIT